MGDAGGEREFRGARRGANGLPPGGKARLPNWQEASQLHNAEIIIYLNRLADLLWLFARWGRAENIELARR